MALKTDYVDDELAVSMGGKRQYNIVDSEGNIIYENVHIEDNSRYSTIGDNFGADGLNEIGEEVNNLSNALSAKGNAQQIVADISATTGIEIGRWIKNNVSIDKLTKGFTFNFIPTQSPGWWSGQMFCDGGSTWWGYYINRDTDIIYRYRYAGDSDSITELNNNMPNYSQILVSSISSGYTSTVKGWLVGSLGQNNATIGLYINNVQIAVSSQGVNANAYINISIPVSVGDVITFSGSPTHNDLKIVGLRW